MKCFWANVIDLLSLSSSVSAAGRIVIECSLKLRGLSGDRSM